MMSRCWVEHSEYDSDSSNASHGDNSTGFKDFNGDRKNEHTRQDLLACFQGVFPFVGSRDVRHRRKDRSFPKGCLSRNSSKSKANDTRRSSDEKLSSSAVKNESTNGSTSRHDHSSECFSKEEENVKGETESNTFSDTFHFQDDRSQQHIGIASNCSTPQGPDEGHFLPDIVSILSASTPLHLRAAPTIKHVSVGQRIGRDNQSIANRWSEPDAGIFLVRGRNYLSDHHKAASQHPALFHARGIDVFQTSTVPQNIANHCPLALLGGKLRELPTFIVNLRFAWGILVCYFGIPERFMPYLRYFGTKQRLNETPNMIDDDVLEEERVNLEASMPPMTPGDRCLARFLMASQNAKKRTLKLIPVVVEGPWVVRKSVTGKPVIIGNKLPVEYYDGDSFATLKGYLECDLDVGNSSVFARNVTSLCRGYSKELTLDFGFVIQGNDEDELPEHLLGAIRVHRLNLEECPPYPGDEIVASTTYGVNGMEQQNTDSYLNTRYVNYEAYSSLDEDEFWDCKSHTSSHSLPLK